MDYSHYKRLLFERRDNGVLLVTINRPDKLNAADADMLENSLRSGSTFSAMTKHAWS